LEQSCVFHAFNLFALYRYSILNESTMEWGHWIAGWW